MAKMQPIPPQALSTQEMTVALEDDAQKSVNVAQQKLSSSMQDYITRFATQFPHFSWDGAIDRNNAMLELSKIWPELPNLKAEAEELRRHINDVVRAAPISNANSRVVLRISVVSPELVLNSLPQPHETAVIATFDGTEGLLRRYIVPVFNELPSFDHMTIHHGLMVLCQPVPPLFNPFSNNRPMGLGGGTGVYGERSRDKFIKGNDIPSEPTSEPVPHAQKPHDSEPAGAEGGDDNEGNRELQKAQAETARQYAKKAVVAAEVYAGIQVMKAAEQREAYKIQGEEAQAQAEEIGFASQENMGEGTPEQKERAIENNNVLEEEQLGLEIGANNLERNETNLAAGGGFEAAAAEYAELHKNAEPQEMAELATSEMVAAQEVTSGEGAELAYSEPVRPETAELPEPAAGAETTEDGTEPEQRAEAAEFGAGSQEGAEGAALGAETQERPEAAEVSEETQERVETPELGSEPLEHTETSEIGAEPQERPEVVESGAEPQERTEAVESDAGPAEKRSEATEPNQEALEQPETAESREEPEAARSEEPREQPQEQSAQERPERQEEPSEQPEAERRDESANQPDAKHYEERQDQPEPERGQRQPHQELHAEPNQDMHSSAHELRERIDHIREHMEHGEHTERRPHASATVGQDAHPVVAKTHAYFHHTAMPEHVAMHTVQPVGHHVALPHSITETAFHPGALQPGHAIGSHVAHATLSAVIPASTVNENGSVGTKYAALTQAPVSHGNDILSATAAIVTTLQTNSPQKRRARPQKTVQSEAHYVSATARTTIVGDAPSAEWKAVQKRVRKAKPKNTPAKKVAKAIPTLRVDEPTPEPN